MAKRAPNTPCGWPVIDTAIRLKIRVKCLMHLIFLRALKYYLSLFSLVSMLLLPAVVSADQADWSTARHWNEALLQAIRKDFARPTVHARNLFHVSAAMWDAFAVYDPALKTLHHHERLFVVDVKAAREEAISFAAYRILRWRFAHSPGAAQSMPAFDQLMDSLGYNRNFTSTVGDTPAALGNRIAQTYIEFGLTDHSNEQNDYENLFYEPVNDPLVPALPGNPEISDPNRWQPLALDFFEDQGGNVIVGGYPGFLSAEWGRVKPFALKWENLTIYQRDGNEYWVYHDPGPPPLLGGAGNESYKTGFEQVLLWSGLLDPTDGELMDISPASNGHNTLGTNDGSGYDKNPVTGLPYEPEIVPAGDYYRVLAEFWADGPNSETPPGHWFAIANYVSDHPLAEKKFRGQGAVLDDLEWDVKLYLTLGGVMHDVAVSVWGMKGWYDWVRPVSAIRYMCDRGQSSDSQGPSYHPDGIHLYPGFVEVITAETAAPGGRHFPLGGNINEHLGKIAVYAWRGPDYVANPATDTAGVGWIRCENWWPYQRPSFVTPPFAGYVSGHSAFSRAAAVIMSQFTGSEFFPGGLGEFKAPKDEFLVFEDGPSVDITLQWASYYDAADETSLSRIYGGIHPTADDIPGRFIGSAIAKDGFAYAKTRFGLSAASNRASFKVSKFFDDGNDVAVNRVSLSCNTGLVLDQHKFLHHGEAVEFVVTDFTDGKLDCTISEQSTDEGYTAQYNNISLGVMSPDGCAYAEVIDGDAFECEITNTVIPVSVAVSTQWLWAGNSLADIDTGYTLTLFCDAEIIDGHLPGNTALDAQQEGASACRTQQDNAGAAGSQKMQQSWCKAYPGSGSAAFSAQVIPEFPASSCYWLESGQDAAVEVDQSDCSSLTISVGQGAACVITNTVFFEGIPTLSQYGIAILALLMLGMGMAGFRK